ncbi:ABC transporter ATP-binding protein [Candidatus Saccharibacteria bacterium]|nr:ABC transporter ATP-binding protein [Candidatus Saccharibacteria bacterium]MCL1963420.1 ABC transporter ATP-binding protein [Candidatus Saccharibacteria bacterium]
MADVIISVENLTRKYGDLVAVDGISFSVVRGSTFAFLGPNGAGKSTTISCLTTLAPFEGKIEIAGRKVGRDDEEIDAEIGVVFQQSLLDPTLTVFDILQTRAKFYGIKRPEARAKIDKMADLIEIREILGRRYGSLSGGQQRRVDIARALIHNPKILFLDEPTTGLDPQGRQLVWETVALLQKELGLTVFLTTHYMEETERANQVYIIDHGHIIAHGTPHRLRAKYANNQLRLQPKDQTLPARLDKMGIKYDVKDDILAIDIETPENALELLDQVRGLISDFEFVHGNMDDVFLKLTGKDLREGKR